MQISIHALREEGDPRPRGHDADSHDFYPRPPRGGRRSRMTAAAESGAFLSTPSARRATRLLRRPPGFVSISIHALREEGDRRPQMRQHAALISIHALREEGDRGSPLRLTGVNVFLSTPSARRATCR